MPPKTLGVRLENMGPTAVSSPGMLTMARVAEENGVDAAHVADHIVFVDGATSHYPFSKDGIYSKPADFEVLEALVSCTWIAAATERLRVGTSVLVLPQRHPLEVAKAAATIDRLSEGRFFLGVGSGWLAEEFAALGQDFATRGLRMDESIEIMRRIWRGDSSAFDGVHYSYSKGVHSKPLPVNRDIPILMGGMTRAAIERAARVGDGWIALADTKAQLTGDEKATEIAGLASRLRETEELLDSNGRNRGEFHAAICLLGRGPEIESVPALVAEFAALGFDEVNVDPPWHDLDKAADFLQECRAALDS